MVTKNLILKIVFIMVLLKSHEEKLVTFVFDLIVFQELVYPSILEDARRSTKWWNKTKIKIIQKIKIWYNITFNSDLNKYILTI